MGGWVGGGEEVSDSARVGWPHPDTKQTLLQPLTLSRGTGPAGPWQRCCAPQPLSLYHGTAFPFPKVWKKAGPAGTAESIPAFSGASIHLMLINWYEFPFISPQQGLICIQKKSRREDRRPLDQRGFRRTANSVIPG